MAKKYLTFAERNELFNAATMAGKASIIASDVLLQLKLENYLAVSGEYFSMPSATKKEQLHDTIDKTIEKRDAKPETDEKPAVCQVCALGGAFASCVRYGNNISTDALRINTYDNEVTVGSPDSPSFRRMYSLLQVAFTEEKLDVMEYCFEQRDVREVLSYSERCAIDKSTIGVRCQELDNDEERLVAIMKHIIKNSGRFTVKGLVLAPGKK